MDWLIDDIAEHGEARTHAGADDRLVPDVSVGAQRDW